MAAVERFHAGLAAAQYDKMCQDIDPQALASVTGLSCHYFLAWLHSRMGNVMEARRAQLPVIEAAPGSVSRVALQYTTRFENGEANERFEWQVSAGAAKVTSYRIDAAALRK